MRRRDDTCLEYWNKVVKIASVEIVEQLSIATQWCFRQETFPKYKCISEEGTEKQVQKILDNLPLTITLYKKQCSRMFSIMHLCYALNQVLDHNSAGMFQQTKTSR